MNDDPFAMKLRMSGRFNRWFLMAGLLIPSVCLWDARAAETAAANAGDFLNSIGACSAVSRRGHNYLTHPGWPGLHDNQTWIAADPSSTCRVDGLFGSYGRTWRKHYAGYAQVQLDALPRVTTETGVTIEGPITEQVQACLYLSVYLDQFKRGWKHTAIYLLRDRTDEAGNQTFGFYRPDYTPRLAATYLHNLTTILADPGSVRRVDTVNYSIADPPPTVHDLLLQKADGTFDLVVWAERFTGGSDSIAVRLGKEAVSVRLFDPTIGVSAVETLRNVDSISLSVANHPVVIEVSGSPR